MKKIILLTLTATVLAFNFALGGEVANLNAVSIGGRIAVPDVMGEFNVIDADGAIVKDFNFNRDSLSVFPNFPLQVNGSSFEGGIFCNMDADDAYEIVYSIGFTIQALNLDGSNVPGWPQTVSYAPEGAPAYGDIDGDNQPEIVVGTIWTMTSGMIYAWELNGTSVTGFPINHGYASRSPVLADLDGDGALEIITNKRMWPLGEAWVYRGDGTVFPGWPQPIDHVPASSAGVGDVTGDGVPEIAVESYDALYVFDINGNVLDGFPFYMPNNAVNSYSSPVLADLDNDGIREIIFGTHVLSGGGYVFIMNNDGTQYPGWPKAVNWWIYGPPAVGYINNDDILDIAVGDQVLSPTPTDHVYAWNANGTPLAGFPIGPINAINNQVALGDLDGDSFTELMFDDNTQSASGRGKYLGYNHDGTPMAGWPIAIEGTSFFNMPCLLDIEGNGILDIIGAGKQGSTNPITFVYLWSANANYVAENIAVPCFQYNSRHDGLFPQEEFVPPDVELTMTPVNPPIIIPPGGGTFQFTAAAVNTGDETANFDFWVMVELPGGSNYGPVFLRTGLTLAGGASISRILQQAVPANAPAGTYQYMGYLGNYSSQTVYSEDSFEFSKSTLDLGAD